jgi:hypothetical protein
MTALDRAPKIFRAPGTKVPPADYHPPALASLAAALIFVANRCCVPMTAPPISESGWLSFCLRLLPPRRRQMFSLFFAKSSFPE